MIGAAAAMGISHPMQLRVRRSAIGAFSLARLAGAVALAGGAGAPVYAHDPFAAAVFDYQPGSNGGFGADLLPDIVLGPPRGGGATQGSLHVLALGIGGSITLEFAPRAICNGPGPDFTIFENVFHIGSMAGPLFTEYAYVAVSRDGVEFVDFPFDAATGVGLAGRTAVFSHPDNGIDPLDPTVSGGDTFDLDSVGLDWVRYVRITDVAGAIPDVGDMPQFTLPPNAGFDLDAAAALHPCDPGALASPTPTATLAPSPVATPSFSPSLPPGIATATPTEVTSAPTHSPTPALSPTEVVPTATATQTGGRPGDLDGDGELTDADLALMIAAIFATGGAPSAGHPADLNDDTRVSAADVVRFAILRLQ